MAPNLRSKHPEHVQAVGMAGMNCQNLPVEPFGFAQASGLMMLECRGEHLLNARRRSLHHGGACFVSAGRCLRFMCLMLYPLMPE